MGDVIDALCDCISLASPTPPGDVENVAAWIESWCKAFGATVERQTVRPGQDNVLVTLDFGPGPVLVFNSHMDVNNPAGQEWKVTSPFRPLQEYGSIYGRGACDAKGSLVAMICAMERLAQSSQGLRGTLTLTAVMGEEEGGIGSLHLVKRGIVADGAVVGEPTESAVAIAHKGTYMKRLRFHGLAAHSGRAWEGVNAVSHAAKFIVEVDRFNQELAKRPHPWVGPATMTTTIFHAGLRQNTVPDLAEVIVDRRLIPGDTHETADGEMALLIERVKQEVPELCMDEPEVIVATVPSETKASERIVKAALLSLSEVVGGDHSPVGFSAGCDMSKLVTVAKIPTVIFGPGSIAQAHVPDEFVSVAELRQAVNVYERIARNFLARD